MAMVTIDYRRLAAGLDACLVNDCLGNVCLDNGCLVSGCLDNGCLVSGCLGMDVLQCSNRAGGQGRRPAGHAGEGSANKIFSAHKL